MGGTVYLLAGTFNVGTTTYTDRAINMATSTRLIGQGDATIIKLQDHDASIYIIYAKNVQDVYIGHLAMDGNEAVQAVGIYYGINFNSTDSSTIEHTYVHDVTELWHLHLINRDLTITPRSLLQQHNSESTS